MRVTHGHGVKRRRGYVQRVGRRVLVRRRDRHRLRGHRECGRGAVRVGESHAVVRRPLVEHFAAYRLVCRNRHSRVRLCGRVGSRAVFHGHGVGLRRDGIRRLRNGAVRHAVLDRDCLDCRGRADRDCAGVGRAAFGRFGSVRRVINRCATCRAGNLNALRSRIVARRRTKRRRGDLFGRGIRRNRQFLIRRRERRARRFHADVVDAVGKADNVAACAVCPTFRVGLLILHCRRDAGELAVVIVGGSAIRRARRGGRLRLCHGNALRVAVRGGRAVALLNNGERTRRNADKRLRCAGRGEGRGRRACDGILSAAHKVGESACVRAVSGKTHIRLGFLCLCCRRCQRDFRRRARCAGDGNLREAVPRHGHAVDCIDAVICREVIALARRVDYKGHGVSRVYGLACLTAFLCHVRACGHIDSVGFPRPLRADSHICVRHGECRAFEYARAGVVTDKCVARAVAVAEAHCVATAVVKTAAVGKSAAAVGRDSADRVGRGVAGEGDSADVLVAHLDGAGSGAVIPLLRGYAVVGKCGRVGIVVERIGEEAVVGVHRVAGEGGAVHIADRHLGWDKEAVADAGSAITPADEAATAVGVRAKQGTVKHAALDCHCAIDQIADQTAVGAVATGGTVDVDAAHAV